MDPKSLLATLARLALASVAGTLVKDGYLQSSGTEAFIGGGMLLATGAWGVWNSYGKDIAKASLELLRAKVMQAAAKAQASPSVATQALASVAAHVVATSPETVPPAPVQAVRPPPATPPPATPPAAAAILVALTGAIALGLLCPGAAYAQTDQDGWFLAPDGVNKCFRSLDGGTTSCTLVGVTNTPFPHCDDGWTLLTYPGTATAVCARDLKTPK